MKLSHTFTFGSLLLLAAFATSAQAQAGKTREQVRAELDEAIRTGDMIAGDSGLKLSDLHPQRYQRPTAAPTLSREQVKAELAEAIRTGDMISGESGRTLYEQFPERYAKARGASQVTPVAAAASAPLR